LHRRGYRLSDAQAGRVDQLLAESDSIRHFVTERIRPTKGGDLTTNEIVSAYFDYCSEKGWVAMERAPKAISGNRGRAPEKHGHGASNELLRKTKNRKRLTFSKAMVFDLPVFSVRPMRLGT
jgi:hypothetical protein